MKLNCAFPDGFNSYIFLFQNIGFHHEMGWRGGWPMHIVFSNGINGSDTVVRNKQGFGACYTRWVVTIVTYYALSFGMPSNQLWSIKLLLKMDILSQLHCRSSEFNPRRDNTKETVTDSTGLWGRQADKSDSFTLRWKSWKASYSYNPNAIDGARTEINESIGSYAPEKTFFFSCNWMP